MHSRLKFILGLLFSIYNKTKKETKMPNQLNQPPEVTPPYFPFWTLHFSHSEYQNYVGFNILLAEQLRA